MRVLLLRLVDLPHPALAQEPQDAVGTEGFAATGPGFQAAVSRLGKHTVEEAPGLTAASAPRKLSPAPKNRRR